MLLGGKTSVALLATVAFSAGGRAAATLTVDELKAVAAANVAAREECFSGTTPSCGKTWDHNFMWHVGVGPGRMLTRAEAVLASGFVHSYVKRAAFFARDVYYGYNSVTSVMNAFFECKDTSAVPSIDFLSSLTADPVSRAVVNLDEVLVTLALEPRWGFTLTLAAAFVLDTHADPIARSHILRDRTWAPIELRPLLETRQLHPAPWKERRARHLVDERDRVIGGTEKNHH